MPSGEQVQSGAVCPGPLWIAGADARLADATLVAVSGAAAATTALGQRVGQRRWRWGQRGGAGAAPAWLQVCVLMPSSYGVFLHFVLHCFVFTLTHRAAQGGHDYPNSHFDCHG